MTISLMFFNDSETQFHSDMTAVNHPVYRSAKFSKNGKITVHGKQVLYQCVNDLETLGYLLLLHGEKILHLGSDLNLVSANKVLNAAASRIQDMARKNNVANYTVYLSSGKYSLVKVTNESISTIIIPDDKDYYLAGSPKMIQKFTRIVDIVNNSGKMFLINDGEVNLETVNKINLSEDPIQDFINQNSRDELLKLFRRVFKEEFVNGVSIRW